MPYCRVGTVIRKILLPILLLLLVVVLVAVVVLPGIIERQTNTVVKHTGNVVPFIIVNPRFAAVVTLSSIGEHVPTNLAGSTSAAVDFQAEVLVAVIREDILVARIRSTYPGEDGHLRNPSGFVHEILDRTILGGVREFQGIATILHTRGNPIDISNKERVVVITRTINTLIPASIIRR